MAKGRGRGKTKVGKIYIFSNLMAILILFQTHRIKNWRRMESMMSKFVYFNILKNLRNKLKSQTRL